MNFNAAFEDLKDARDNYRIAAPFSHIVFKDFLNRNLCDELLAQFPPVKPEVRTLHQAHGGRLGKSKYENVKELGSAYLKLDEILSSHSFLKFLTGVTGIPNLLYDPKYYGGGTHESLNGECLLPHIDFNYYPNSHLYRRLNLLIYLNRDWHESWGGHLDLHSNPFDPAQNQTLRCPIDFNSAVLFSTTSKSWHGFERIELPAGKRHESRKCIAVYFYTHEAPSDDVHSRRSTVYVNQPLSQDLFTKGKPIQEAHHHEMNEKFGLRHWQMTDLISEIGPTGWQTLNSIKAKETLSAEDIALLNAVCAESDQAVRHLERILLMLKNLTPRPDFNAIGDPHRSV